MNDLVAQFEAQCIDAGVKPAEALRAGGVNKATWWRWKSGNLPSLRCYQLALDGLDKLKSPTGAADIAA